MIKAAVAVSVLSDSARSFVEHPHCCSVPAAVCSELPVCAPAADVAAHRTRKRALASKASIAPSVLLLLLLLLLLLHDCSQRYCCQASRVIRCALLGLLLLGLGAGVTLSTWYVIAVLRRDDGNSGLVEYSSITCSSSTRVHSSQNSRLATVAVW
jgi:hypothetical protein